MLNFTQRQTKNATTKGHLSVQDAFRVRCPQINLHGALLHQLNFSKLKQTRGTNVEKVT